MAEPAGALQISRIPTRSCLCTSVNSLGRNQGAFQGAERGRTPFSSCDTSRRGPQPRMKWPCPECSLSRRASHGKGTDLAVGWRGHRASLPVLCAPGPPELRPHSQVIWEGGTGQLGEHSPCSQETHPPLRAWRQPVSQHPITLQS